MIYNKTTWTSLVLTLFALPFVFSCSSDDEEQPTESKRYLSVVVSENPLQDETAEGRTRAEAPITTASLSEFSMNYPPGNANTMSFNKNSGDWNQLVWPIIGEDPYNRKFDFYAYNGGTFNANENNPFNPFVSFSVEESVGSQKDLLVAKHENISYNDHGGVVSLTFDHACAAVQFTICKTQATQEGETRDIVVKNVVLKNVIKTGDYYYGSEPRWSLGGTTTDYTLYEGEMTLETNPNNTLLPCKWLYLIPQDKTGITLDITYTVNSVEKQKAITIGTDSWAAGYSYTINIKVGTSFLK